MGSSHFSLPNSKEYRHEPIAFSVSFFSPHSSLCVCVSGVCVYQEARVYLAGVLFHLPVSWYQTYVLKPDGRSFHLLSHLTHSFPPSLKKDPNRAIKMAWWVEHLLPSLMTSGPSHGGKRTPTPRECHGTLPKQTNKTWFTNNFKKWQDPQPRLSPC